MELILLKSSICLMVLLLFYKIVLEPLSVHKFKRAYLLVAVLVAAIIPFITFIKYVEPTFYVSYLETFHSDSLFIPLENEVLIEEPLNYIPTILWSIYALGASLFFIRFCVNVFRMVSKIRNHKKVKSNRFVNVLMEQLEIPHTFFNFIFLNKTKFENNEIPTEVLLHEQTHAKQKHSLDIIIIELLQVIFWFNPLLYWLKKEVKLNHEFLADQAVLNNGIDTKNYQNILLQFSSSQQNLALVNAINYSSIKKRFLLMKTKTSKQAVWLRSLLLLPLLAILLYSFSETEEVEKEVVAKLEINNKNTPAMLFEDEKDKQSNSITEDIEDDLEKIGQLKINYTKPKLLVNAIDCDKCELSFTKDEFLNLKLSTNTSEKITSFNFKVPGQPTVRVKGNTLSSEAIEYFKKGKENDLFQIFHIQTKENLIDSYISIFIKENIKKATAKEVADYNAWAKKIKSKTTFVSNKAKLLPIAEEKNLKKYIDVYTRMTMEQKEQSERMPFEGLKIDNNKTKSTQASNLNLKQKSKQEKLKSPKVIEVPLDVIEINGEQHYMAKNNNETRYYNKWMQEVDVNGEFLDINLLENTNPKLLVNGIECDKCTLNLTKEELSNLTLTTSTSESILSFKLKIPGIKTQYYTSNVIDNNGKSLISRVKIGSTIQLFDIKSKNRAYGYFGSLRIKLINKKASLPIPPPPPISPNASPEQKAKQEKIIKEYYKNNKVVKGIVMKNPPLPPKPRNPIDQIVKMAKKGATFYYNGDAITSDKAIALIKKNPKLNMSSNTNNGVSIVHLSEKGIKTVNGKMVKE